MKKEYHAQLHKVLEVQADVRDLHPFLERVFPIAVVEQDHFLIYDLAPASAEYRLVKEAAAPMPIPVGVRAAFQLESYQDRMACVVTPEVFDELGGYVTIFHEFMHCQQAELCEEKLKQQLSVARQAQAINDYMWEINHPFPYAAPEFAQAYQSFLSSTDLPEIGAIREQLKATLTVEDYEYMGWQEWKEGFARFIENLIKNRLGLPENHGGSQQPFTRVSFYAGGEHYIRILAKSEAELVQDIERLFARIV